MMNEYTRKKGREAKSNLKKETKAAHTQIHIADIELEWGKRMLRTVRVAVKWKMEKWEA